jgi:hypothetical protein
MGETWEHLHRVPMVGHVRRSPMEALDIETSRAEGEPALQALLTFVRENAGQRAAHEAEQGIFTRLLPMGLAAMQLSFAQCGPGEGGPAVPRADGVLLPREQQLRGRDDCSSFGQFKVARPGYRAPADPGSFPRDASVPLPERCSSYFLQEWMPVVEGEPPCQESAGFFAPLCALEVAERVLMEVAPEAPQDYQDFSAPRPLAPEDPVGALLGVSCDGQGVPMSKAEAAKLQAKVGTGEQRQQKKAALVGVSDTVAPKPRSAEALAALLGEPAAARGRRQRQGEQDASPRAPQVRRVASLGRTKQAVRELSKAEAERRAPQPCQPLVGRLAGALGLGSLAPKRFKEGKRVTFGLDLMPGVGDLWGAAHAGCGEASQTGKHGVQQKLTEMLRGRGGSVIGGLRQSLPKQQRRKSVREALATVLTFCHHPRRWRRYDLYLAAGWPVGTGVVESACGSVVKHRMEGEGKRWRLEGAEAILTWRSLKKSHHNDLRDYGRFRAGQERVRLSTSKPKDRPTARLRCVA